MAMDWRAKIRVMPLLVVVASLAFVVRVGEFATGLSAMGTAVAQEEVRNVAPPPMGQGAAANQGPEGVEDLQRRIAQTGESIPSSGMTLPAPVASGSRGEWRDAGDTDIDQSSVRTEIYQDLAKRRDTLDTREKEIAVREALLSAAERELDQKVRELNTVREEIEVLMKKRSEEEEARISSLVKIYEGMKPKDAARIFNTLDLDVLIAVMTRMSERRSSPILAEMEVERARTVTILMSEQKKMPILPPN